MVKFIRKSWGIGDIYNTTQERLFKSGGCQVIYSGVTRELRKLPILDRWKSIFFRNKSVMNTLWVTFSFQVMSNESGKTYPVKIRVQYDPHGELVDTGKIQIYCGCPDFKFNSAYVLNRNRALYRSDQTDLELGPSITTAPKREREGILCKHSYAAVRYLRENYKKLMSYV